MLYKNYRTEQALKPTWYIQKNDGTYFHVVREKISISESDRTGDFDINTVSIPLRSLTAAEKTTINDITSTSLPLLEKELRQIQKKAKQLQNIRPLKQATHSIEKTV